MDIVIYQVDAFTHQPFTGNPAGICILEEDRDAAWMQKVAAEMNLAETAFLKKREDGFNLRWFKPSGEVDLCGHATLASAHILYETGLLEKNQIAKFHTHSGLLTACLKDQWIELNYPSLPVQPAHIPGLANILGVTPLFCGSNQIHYLLEVECEDIVRNLRPDFTALSNFPVRGIMITSISKGNVDFVSRYFAPSVGNNEDPVTGSAHCALGPYWQQKLGKNTFTAYQASARGGIVKVTMHDDRVFLSGQAITIMQCTLLRS